MKTDSENEVVDSTVDNSRGKFVVNANPHQFSVGEKFEVIVTSIRTEAVYVEVPGGYLGMVSPRCWGVGASRTQALAQLHPGDRLDVVVRLWCPLTKTLSLVLPGHENIVACAQKRKNWRSSMGGKTTTKPPFKGIAKGAIFVFDLASVFGKLPHSYFCEFIPTVRSALQSEGYSTIFFIEKRAMYWVWAKVFSRIALERFADECKAEDVTIVSRGEADLPILQTVTVLDNAYAVSADWFTDYRAAFPNIVGSDRVRKFSLAKLPGAQVLLTIDGLSKGIVLKTPSSTAA